MFLFSTVLLVLRTWLLSSHQLVLASIWDMQGQVMSQDVPILPFPIDQRSCLTLLDYLLLCYTLCVGNTINVALPESAETCVDASWTHEIADSRPRRQD